MASTACVFVLSIVFWFVFGTESHAEDILTRRDSQNISSPIQLKLTLFDAIELARKNYPEIRAARFHAEAVRGGITKARTAYLPNGSLLAEELRGTSNNITGPLFPQFTIPNISGGVKGLKNDMIGGWGSAAGILLSWEPFDFGLRKAKVNYARSAAKQAESQLTLTELDVISDAAEKFLKALLAQQALKTAQARLDRMMVFADTVRVLTEKELKPGTDYSLAQAELANSKDELIVAQQNLEVAIAHLQGAVGIDSESLAIDDAPLLVREPDTAISFIDPVLHPSALIQQSAIELAHRRRMIIERTYAPQFNLLSAVYARGSSFRTDVSIDESKGYYPQKFNYAVGLALTFPFLDAFAMRADRTIAIKTEQEEKTRYDLVLLNLRTQDKEARARIKAAIALAENAPVKVKAATEAAHGVKVRYENGLATVNDVAQDEQLLTQAEVDQATAQLRVWYALLAADVASGDLKPFIEQVSRVSNSRR